MIELPSDENWKPAEQGHYYRWGTDPNETEPLWDDWFYDIDTWGEWGVREVDFLVRQIEWYWRKP